jgi:hypothetical protein
MAAVAKAGITWRLARTWAGGAERERQLKRQGGAARRCPLCGVAPRSGALPRNMAGGVARSLVSDVQLAAAGLMTSADRAVHSELRRGAAAGRVPGMVRLPAVPVADPWYAALYRLPILSAPGACSGMP